MSDSHEWMRNHNTEGSVVGRFAGMYGHTEQELVALQTMDGIVVIPAVAAVPIDTTYIINQTALDLERVIRGMREGGLTFEQIEHAWQQALLHIKQADRGD